MVDRIRFRWPAGPIGVPVDRLLLERYMRRLIMQRNAHRKRELEAPAA